MEDESYSLQLHTLLNGAFPDAPAMYFVDMEYIREKAEEIIQAIREAVND